MLSFDFAYSGTMQFVLFFETIVTNTLCYYFSAKVLLLIYNRHVSAKRIWIFSIILGAILYTGFIYAVYFIGNNESFGPASYTFLTNPSPFIAIASYFLAVYVLGLSPYSSIRVMRLFYVYVLSTILLKRWLGFTLLNQPPEGPYNYLVDALSVLLTLGFSYVIYLLTCFFINKSALLIRIQDNIIVKNIYKDITKSILEATAVYLFVCISTIYFEYSIFYYLVGSVLLVLYLALLIQIDYTMLFKADLANKDAYIDSLVRGIHDFRDIKHDFYNILSTYTGYMAIGNYEHLKEYHKSVMNITINAGTNLELSALMEKNPSLMSLLMAKGEYAAQRGVSFKTTILCDVADLYIDNIDACRVIGTLLDNAIEDAAFSEKKRVLFSIEQKARESKLIVISNTTATDVDDRQATDADCIPREGRLGAGLSQARRTLGRHPNCRLNFSCYNFEVSAYLEFLRLPARNNFRGVISSA